MGAELIMCGIAGIVGQYANKELLDKMLAQQVHRGPDGEGRHHEPGLAMGMRRLSIIDLEHGWQPLASRNNRVLAFQNGEIYNYKELKREIEQLGYRFTTQSDTEVLAHGYDAWGFDKLLARIDGMYAIAILDRDRRELHLARDRFGEKPLFYTASKGYFAYASSLKSIAVLPWFDKSIDPYGLDRYLALHYVPGEHTIFRQVRRLLPGCSMTISIDNPTNDGLPPKYNRYYKIPLRAPSRVDQEHLNEEVQKAVRSRLVSDVPVGVFLSGGIDSSIIAALAARENQHISTYSIGFPGYEGDESIHAEAVARHLGTRHQTFHFDSKQFQTLLPQVAAALDEPIGDQATLPLYWLCREASREVKVVLSGEGGDEFFGGYGYYRPFVVPSNWSDKLAWLLNNPNRIAPPLLGEAETASGFPILAGSAERSRITGFSDFEASEWEIDTLEWLNQSRDPLQRATAADIAGWLPDDLLIKLDRIGMAHSLEGRAPFLTPALADIALNIAQTQRIGATTKVALRDVAKHLLPFGITDRPKQGFVLPMKDWIISWFNEMGGVESLMTKSPLNSYLNAEHLSNLIKDDFDKGIKRERLIFSILMLSQWVLYN
jgi:asparagine synthase (glutamine-hydrolysing)